MHPWSCSHTAAAHFHKMRSSPPGGFRHITARLKHSRAIINEKCLRDFLHFLQSSLFYVMPLCSDQIASHLTVITPDP
jgi:hypothetical protein